MHTIECTQSLSVFDRINRLHTIAHMTLSSIHGDVVKAWLSTNNNMTEECRGEERKDLRNELTTLNRREIDQKFPNLDEDARWDKYRDEKQINRRLAALLRVHRNSIIQPENTNHGLEQGLVGENSGQGERLKAANATLNAINNPLNNPANNAIAS